MAEAASRAGRKRAEGGPNARFVVCAAEALPGELDATADLVTIQFPWGSLLRGIVLGEPDLLGSPDCLAAEVRGIAGVASLCSEFGPRTEIQPGACAATRE